MARALQPTAPAGPAIPRPVRLGASATGGFAAERVLAALLTFATVVSTSSFNPVLLGLPPENSLQQVLTMAAWGAVIAVSLRMAPRRRMVAWLDVVAIALFFGLAVASVLWSDLAAASALKAIALAVTTLGAFRLALGLPVDRIAESAFRGLAIVSAASLAVVILRPDLGILHVWAHDGLWSGVFESKQSLGLAGAFLMYFAVCRLVSRSGRLASLLGFGLGTACVIGSGSRGEGAVALAAILCVVVSGRSLSLSRLLAFAPFAITVAAGLVLLHVGLTGRTYLEIFGQRTDLTERLLIWQYGLSNLADHLFLGYGLNGFWSDPVIYSRYLRAHGWVLDNFHSGYLTILMETGLAGFSLFALGYGLFGLRMAWLAGRGLVVPAQFNLVVGFICLVFVNDATETFFLRSTNIIAALATAFLFASATELREPRPGATAEPVR